MTLCLDIGMSRTRVIRAPQRREVLRATALCKRTVDYEHPDARTLPFLIVLAVFLPRILKRGGTGTGDTRPWPFLRATPAYSAGSRFCITGS